MAPATALSLNVIRTFCVHAFARTCSYMRNRENANADRVAYNYLIVADGKYVNAAKVKMLRKSRTHQTPHGFASGTRIQSGYLHRQWNVAGMLAVKCRQSIKLFRFAKQTHTISMMQHWKARARNKLQRKKKCVR